MSYKEWEPYYREFGPMIRYILEAAYTDNPDLWIRESDITAAITPKIAQSFPKLTAAEIDHVCFKLIVWLPMNGYAEMQTEGSDTLLRSKPHCL